MAIQDFIIGLGAKLKDEQTFLNQVDNLRNAAEKRGEIKVNFKKINKTSITEMSEDTAQVLSKALGIEANMIDRVTLRMAEVRRKTGEHWSKSTFEKAVSGAVYLKNEMGDIIGEIPLNFLRASEKIEKYTSTFKQNLGKTAKDATKEWKAMNREFNADLSSAAKFAAKYQNVYTDAAMAGKDAYSKMKDYFSKIKGLDPTKKEDIKKIQELATKFRAESTVVKESEKSLLRPSGALRDWGSAMSNAIKQTVVYTFTLGAVMKAQQEWNKAIQFTVQLNKEMTKIQVLGVQGARTSEEISNLSFRFNELASEMGATTIEIARASVEWLRQGKTVEETEKLIRSSMMLSKLGAIESGQATEYLTAITNAYNLKAEDTITIVDKLVAVDNIAATSAGELATAISYSAVSAQQVGISFEKLTAYIATVSSVTRGSAESIGQAFKTITTRLVNMRESAMQGDEVTADSLNNTERALSKVGIRIRDSEENFRDMDTVLEEVAQKWSTMSEMEQAEITKAIAGTHQREKFLVLMENMDDAMKYYTAELDSAGLAEGRFGIYTENLEAKMNKYQASMEKLYITTVNSDFVKGVVDLGIAFNKLLDSTGGLTNLVWILSGAFLALNSRMVAANLLMFYRNITHIGSAIAQVITALTTMKFTAISAGTAISGAIGVIGIAITVITMLVMAHNAALEETKRKYEEARDSAIQYGESAKSIEADIKKITSDYDTFDKLSRKVKDGITLTKEESDKLRDVQNEIKYLAKETAGTYDAQGNFLVYQNLQLDDILKKTRERLKLEQTAADSAAYTAASLFADQLKNAEKEKNIQAEINDLKNKGLAGVNFGGDIKAALGEKYGLTPLEISKYFQDVTDATAYKAQYDYQKLISDFEVTFTQASPEMQQTIQGFFEKTLTDPANASVNAVIDTLVTGIIDSNKAISISAEEANSTLTSMVGGAQTASQALSSMWNDGKLSSEAAIQGVDELNTKMVDLANFALTNGDKLFPGMSEEEDKAWRDRIYKDIELLKSSGETLAKTKEKMNEITDLQTQSQEKGFSVTSAWAEKLSQTIIDGNIQIKDSQGNIISGYTNILNWVYQNANNIPAIFTAITNSVDTMIKTNGATWADIMNAIGKSAVISNLVGFQLTKGIVEPSTPSGAGGSGGTAGKTEEQRAREEKIKALEKEKEALQERLDEYKKYIDIKKRELELLKKEKEYLDDLEKKNKKLAQLKTQIALLSLDSSEEAQAQRLKLEEDAAAAEEEIAKIVEDRKYEIQQEALDEQARIYEEKMNKKIKAIDDEIKSINEVTDATNSSTDAVNNNGQQWQTTGEKVDIILKNMKDMIVQSGQEIDKITFDKLPKMMQGWIDNGMSAETAAKRAWDYYLAIQAISKLPFWGNAGVQATEQHGESFRDYYQYGQNGEKPHYGGIIGTLHNGGFTGNFRSNEVFAKLLKGEYVATEGQMNNFLSNILPKVANGINTKSTAGVQSINLSMPINVEGNLDKSVIPDIEKITDKVVSKLNDTMKQRGYIRQTTLTSI